MFSSVVDSYLDGGGHAPSEVKCPQDGVDRPFQKLTTTKLGVDMPLHKSTPPKFVWTGLLRSCLVVDGHGPSEVNYYQVGWTCPFRS